MDRTNLLVEDIFQIINHIKIRHGHIVIPININVEGNLQDYRLGPINHSSSDNIQLPQTNKSTPKNPKPISNSTIITHHLLLSQTQRITYPICHNPNSMVQNPYTSSYPEIPLYHQH